MKFIIEDYGGTILRMIWFLLAIQVLLAIYRWVIPYMQALESAF